jgi:hypothetical protein
MKVKINKTPFILNLLILTFSIATIPTTTKKNRKLTKQHKHITPKQMILTNYKKINNPDEKNSEKLKLDYIKDEIFIIGNESESSSEMNSPC